MERNANTIPAMGRPFAVILYQRNNAEYDSKDIERDSDKNTPDRKPRMPSTRQAMASPLFRLEESFP